MRTATAIALAAGLAAAGVFVSAVALVSEIRRIRRTRRNVRRVLGAPSEFRAEEDFDYADGRRLFADLATAIESGGGVATADHDRHRPPADLVDAYGFACLAVNDANARCELKLTHPGPHRFTRFPISALLEAKAEHPAGSSKTIANTDAEERCGAFGSNLQSRGLVCNAAAGHDGDHTATVATSPHWPSAPQPASWPQNEGAQYALLAEAADEDEGAQWQSN